MDRTAVHFLWLSIFIAFKSAAVKVPEGRLLFVSTNGQDEVVTGARGTYEPDGEAHGFPRYCLQSDTIKRFLYRSSKSGQWTITASELNIEKSKGTIVSLEASMSPIKQMFKFYSNGKWIVDESFKISELLEKNDRQHDNEHDNVGRSKANYHSSRTSLGSWLHIHLFEANGNAQVGRAVYRASIVMMLLVCLYTAATRKKIPRRSKMVILDSSIGRVLKGGILKEPENKIRSLETSLSIALENQLASAKELYEARELQSKNTNELRDALERSRLALLEAEHRINEQQKGHAEMERTLRLCTEDLRTIEQQAVAREEQKCATQISALKSFYEAQSTAEKNAADSRVAEIEASVKEAQEANAQALDEARERFSHKEKEDVDALKKAQLLLRVANHRIGDLERTVRLRAEDLQAIKERVIRDELERAAEIRALKLSCEAQLTAEKVTYESRITEIETSAKETLQVYARHSQMDQVETDALRRSQLLLREAEHKIEAYATRICDLENDLRLRTEDFQTIQQQFVHEGGERAAEITASYEEQLAADKAAFVSRIDEVGASVKEAQQANAQALDEALKQHSQIEKESVDSLERSQTLLCEAEQRIEAHVQRLCVLERALQQRTEDMAKVQRKSAILENEAIELKAALEKCRDMLSESESVNATLHEDRRIETSESGAFAERMLEGIRATEAWAATSRSDLEREKIEALRLYEEELGRAKSEISKLRDLNTANSIQIEATSAAASETLSRQKTAFSKVLAAKTEESQCLEAQLFEALKHIATLEAQSEALRIESRDSDSRALADAVGARDEAMASLEAYRASATETEFASLALRKRLTAALEEISALETTLQSKSSRNDSGGQISNHEWGK